MAQFIQVIVERLRKKGAVTMLEFLPSRRSLCIARCLIGAAGGVVRPLTLQRSTVGILHFIWEPMLFVERAFDLRFQLQHGSCFRCAYRCGSVRHGC